MTGSVQGDTAHTHQQLNIQLSIEPSNAMSCRLGHGSGPHVHNVEGGQLGKSSLDRASNSTYPFTMLGPGQVSSVSRRHSMTVQDMLNPSDEDPRRSSQSHSSLSGDDDESRSSGHQRHGSSSYRANKSSRHDSHSHQGNLYRTSPRGSHRPSRRPSPSSSGSETGEIERRAFRKPYTVEEAHFIW